MNLSDIVDIAVAGLEAQKARLAVTASNIANSETTRTAAGGPYRRRDVVLRSKAVGDPFDAHLARQIRTVSVDRVVSDSRGSRAKYDPGHPDADESGFVQYPRVNVIEEQTNLMSASRAFEANLFLLSKVRSMAQAAMQIGR